MVYKPLRNTPPTHPENNMRNGVELEWVGGHVIVYKPSENGINKDNIQKETRTPTTPKPVYPPYV